MLGESFSGKYKFKAMHKALHLVVQWTLAAGIWLFKSDNSWYFISLLSKEIIHVKEKTLQKVMSLSIAIQYKTFVLTGRNK